MNTPSSFLLLQRPQKGKASLSLLEALITPECEREQTLMGADCLRLCFRHTERIDLAVGDFVETPQGRFVLTQAHRPSYEQSTAAYRYDLQLHAPHALWGLHLMALCHSRGGGRPPLRADKHFSLTAPLAQHLDLLMLNLRALGLHFAEGQPYSYRVHEAHFLHTAPSTAVSLQYEGASLLQALEQLCSEQAYHCEWWLEGSVLHLGLLGEGNTPRATLRQGIDAHFEREESSTPRATRHYVVGGKENLPPHYGRTLRFVADGAALREGLLCDGLRPLLPDFVQAESKSLQARKFAHEFSPQERMLFTYEGVHRGYSDPSDPNIAPEADEDHRTAGRIVAAMPQATFTMEAQRHYAISSTLRLLTAHPDKGKSALAGCEGALQLVWEALPSDKSRVIEVEGKRLQLLSTLNAVGAFPLGLDIAPLKTTTTRRGLYLLTTDTFIDTPFRLLRVEGEVSLREVNAHLRQRIRIDIPQLGIRGAEARYVADHPDFALRLTDTAHLQSLKAWRGGELEFIPSPLLRHRLPLSYYVADAERGDLASVSLSGLRLPKATCPEGFIDHPEGTPEAQRVERVLTLPHIFPKVEQRVGDIKVEHRKVGEAATHPHFAISDRNALFKLEPSLRIEGAELRVKFESGLLAGMEFGASPDYTHHRLQLLPNERYGALLPNATLRPQEGDGFVLLGFNPQLLEEGVIAQAEERLLSAAREIVEREARMADSYSLTMLPQVDSHGRVLPAPTLRLGDTLQLREGKELTPPLRVVSLSHPLDLPHLSPQYRLAQLRKPSALQQLRADAEGERRDGAVQVVKPDGWSSEQGEEGENAMTDALGAALGRLTDAVADKLEVAEKMKGQYEAAQATLQEISSQAWKDKIITTAESKAIAQAKSGQVESEWLYLLARADAVLAAHPQLRATHRTEYEAIASLRTDNARRLYNEAVSTFTLALTAFARGDLRFGHKGRMYEIPPTLRELMNVRIEGKPLGEWYVEKRNAFEAAIVAADRGKDGTNGVDGRSPYINAGGTWEVWDDVRKIYVDTHDPARGDDGHSPRINGDYWEVWENGRWTSTGVKAKGEDGKSAKGKDGRGIASITPLYKLHDSKTAAPTAPTANALNGWQRAKPFYEVGKFLWRCEEQRFSDGTKAFTAPMLESEWEALQQVEMGDGANYFGFGRGHEMDTHFSSPSVTETTKRYKLRATASLARDIKGLRIRITDKPSQPYGKNYATFLGEEILLRLRKLGFLSAGWHTASFDVRVVSSGGSPKSWGANFLHFDLCDTGSLRKPLQSSTDWQRVELNAEVKSYWERGGHFNGFLDIELRAPYSLVAVGDVVEIRNLQIERGMIASPYRPSLDYLTQLLSEPSGINDGVVFGGRMDVRQGGETKALFNGINLNETPVLAAGNIQYRDHKPIGANVEIWADGRTKLGKFEVQANGNITANDAHIRGRSLLSGLIIRELVEITPQNIESYCDQTFPNSNSYTKRLDVMKLGRWIEVKGFSQKLFLHLPTLNDRDYNENAPEEWRKTIRPFVGTDLLVYNFNSSAQIQLNGATTSANAVPLLKPNEMAYLKCEIGKNSVGFEYVYWKALIAQYKQ